MLESLFKLFQKELKIFFVFHVVDSVFPSPLNWRFPEHFLRMTKLGSL
jgi:hypothetical protein